MFTVYLIETTRIFKSCETERAAKSCVTRLNNQCYAKGATEPKYAYAHSDYYHNCIERMVERVNLMSGKKFMESVNTPWGCSPASETYWSS